MNNGLRMGLLKAGFVSKSAVERVEAEKVAKDALELEAKVARRPGGASLKEALMAREMLSGMGRKESFEA